MITGYTIIRPDGTEEQHHCDLAEKPFYLEVKNLVEPLLGGELLERERVWYQGKATDMFYASLGRNTTVKRGPLPRNEKATAIYLDRWPQLHPLDDPESMRYVAGNAVIFHRPIW
jgi:hypothetical protein